MTTKPTPSSLNLSGLSLVLAGCLLGPVMTQAAADAPGTTSSSTGTTTLKSEHLSPPRPEIGEIPPPPPPKPPGKRRTTTSDLEFELGDSLDRARVAVKSVADTMDRGLLNPLDAWDPMAGGWAGRSGSVPRSLVIPNGAADSKMMHEADEDLRILTRLLGKTLTKRGGDDSDPAGANKLPGQDRGRTLRAIHLQGYGALLMFQVNFPLVGSNDAEEAPKVKSAPASPWDETKRELFGKAKPGKSFMLFRDGKAQPEFDPARVEALKNDLVDVLKQASNMRHLGPSESVTVTLQGPGRAPREAAQAFKGELGEKVVGFINFNDDSKEPGSTLLIRATKADIDALAKGTIDTNAFRAKIQMQIY